MRGPLAAPWREGRPPGSCGALTYFLPALVTAGMGGMVIVRVWCRTWNRGAELQ
jgi:hypothetical protein